MSTPHHDDVARADRVALDSWHVVGVVDELPLGQARNTRLLDTGLTLTRAADGEVAVRVTASRRMLPVQRKFGYVWTSLGAPARDIFDIPEYDEPDRRSMNAASVGLHASAPRAVENFLDLGHFAFVHTHYLGIEPYTEIKPYKVEVTSGGHEVLATRCLAYQPRASTLASAASEVDYTYRVPHPYCAILYKSNVIDPARRDVIALFVQPASEERVIAHMLCGILDDVSSDNDIRRYQQLIFSQDKPILENQVPKRLPLDLRAEISARADASSSTYRRWLSDQGVRYGVIPVPV